MLTGLTLGVWSHCRDITMVGTVYWTKITSSVGSASANTSHRGFIRLLLLNFRSAIPPQLTQALDQEQCMMPIQTICRWTEAVGKVPGSLCTQALTA